jgi:hypothetical protein
MQTTTATASARVLRVDPAAASDSTTFSAISAAVASLQPGDTVKISPGIYRESVSIDARGTPEAPITIEAETPGTVILTGADEVRDWRPIAGTPLWESEIKLNLPASPKHGLLAGRCEQVFVDGVPLRQCLRREDLCAGSFCYEEERGCFVIWPAPFTTELEGGQQEFDTGAITGGAKLQINRADPDQRWQYLRAPFSPERHLIEVTTRSRLLDTAGGFDNSPDGSAHIVIRGLIFRASGDQPQKPMVRLGGNGHRVEECVLEYGAARGLDIRSNDTVVRRCTIRLNGQMGFAGYGRGWLVEDCDILYNNTKHSDFVCFEQGGCKIVRAHDCTMRRVRAIGNDGPGIWFDIDNERILIEQCWCEANTGPGIMYEISSTAVIRNNVCLRNGILPRKDATFNSTTSSVIHPEPVYGQGILVQMSRDCEVYNNTCVGNHRVGIELRHHPYQQAGNPGHSPDRYKLRDNRIFNNLLADNGWDAIAITSPPALASKSDEVSGNHSDYNLIFHSAARLARPDAEGYARWGKAFAHGTQSLEEWRVYSGQDYNSIQWDPMFINPESKDFRVERTSPAIARGKKVEDLDEDYLGRRRPDGEEPTIGAFEFHPEDGFPIPAALARLHGITQQ